MNNAVRTLGIAALIASGVIALPGLAGTVTGLVTFTANTPARAAEVNGNFTAVKTAVDDNQAQITALTARVAALESQLTNLTALNAYLSLQMVNGHPTVRVSAANFQVVNGEGSTAKVNGLGNLIVGYDEARADTAVATCSIGVGNSVYVSEADCTAAGGAWAINHKSGSHNVIVGTYNNYSSYAGAVFGERNAATSKFASVLGGQRNVAGGEYASVVNGVDNGAWGATSSISNGNLNQATGLMSHVAGGRSNVAQANFSAVLGGFLNFALGTDASITGGRGNQATGPFTVVSGGVNNSASGDASTVSGGALRRTTLDGSWAGGAYNSAN